MSLSLREPSREPIATPVTPGAATALLETYRPATDRFLATPHRTLLGRGTAARIPHDSRPPARRVREALEALRRPGAPAPVVVGALPFAPDAPASLAVPETVRWAPPLREDPLIALPVPEDGERRGWRVREVPTAERYGEAVAAAVALLESEKDLHEHAVVVAAVRESLAPFCTDLEAPERPTLVRTAAMWHLSTTVTGTLADPGTTALDLASALHPTPAVCGTPTDLARRVIAESEPFDRGPYTGMVGWQDADGDGEWVVTIRCAEAEGRTLRLFAGAGVVAASTSEAETAETAAKFRTFLHAVGASL
jgi:isochorismate synthase EntC